MNKKLPKAFTDSEVEALWSVISHPRDRCAFALWTLAGLRVTTSANVKLQDIDWERNILTVTTKGNKEGQIAISDKLRVELERCVKARPVSATHDYLLWNLRNPSLNKPVSRQALSKMLAKAGKGITSRKIHPHMGRHYLGKVVYAQTGDINAVRETLMHEHIETSKVYSHFSTEKQSELLNNIQKRPLLFRLYDKVRPRFTPFKPNRTIAIGEIVGRENEITAVRKNIKKGLHTVLIGDMGVGKKAILSTITDTYRLAQFSPLRVQLLELAKQMNQHPTGRSGEEILTKLLATNPTGTLIVEGVSDLSKASLNALRKLSRHLTIITSVEQKHHKQINAIFFGTAQIIEVKPLHRKSAYALIEHQTHDMHIPNLLAYQQHVYEESKGYPESIIQLVTHSRKTGELSPEGSGVYPVLPAKYFLIAFSGIRFTSRYISTSIADASFKVMVTGLIVCIVPFMLLDLILKSADK